MKDMEKEEKALDLLRGGKPERSYNILRGISVSTETAGSILKIFYEIADKDLWLIHKQVEPYYVAYDIGGMYYHNYLEKVLNEGTYYIFCLLEDFRNDVFQRLDFIGLMEIARKKGEEKYVTRDMIFEPYFSFIDQLSGESLYIRLKKRVEINK